MTPCAAANCERSRRSGEYCNAHYLRDRKGSPMDTPLRAKRPRGAPGIRDALGRKLCVMCLSWWPESGFPKRSNTPDGLYPYCKPCACDATSKQKFGISREEVSALAETQGGCLGCRTTAARWVVDHDRSCCSSDASCGSCIRGVPCPTCNSALGLARDNPETLRRLADYLERVPSKS